MHKKSKVSLLERVPGKNVSISIGKKKTAKIKKKTKNQFL